MYQKGHVGILLKYFCFNCIIWKNNIYYSDVIAKSILLAKISEDVMISMVIVFRQSQTHTQCFARECWPLHTVKLKGISVGRKDADVLHSCVDVDGYADASNCATQEQQSAALPWPTVQLSPEWMHPSRQLFLWQRGGQPLNGLCWVEAWPSQHHWPLSFLDLCSQTQMALHTVDVFF